MKRSYRVLISKRALKDLESVPDYVVLKLLAWRDGIQRLGLMEMRKWPGFHDEPLKGKREGQRSIRLSRGYRAIYRELRGDTFNLLIEEITKHDY